MRTERLHAVAVLVALATAAPLSADAPRVHALTGVRIVVAPGKIVEEGVVVVRDGIIEAAGAGVAVPADARVWERDGLTVYPGLIDSFMPLSWPESIEKEDPPQAGHENALVRPEREMGRHAHDVALGGRYRQAGFTTAVVAPKEGLFRGRAAVVNLGDGSPGANLLRRDAGQVIGFARSSEDVYPESLMGSIALFRQTILDARWYADAWRAYEANPAQPRPAMNTALAALGEVAGGEAEVLFVSRSIGDSLRAAEHAADLGLRLRIVGNGHEYEWLEEIAAAGAPHVVPVAFPDDPEVGEEDDLSVSMADLRHWDQAPSNPRKLLDAGVSVAFTAHDLGEPKKIHSMLARAIEADLTADEALAGLTTTPAALLGLSDRAGTVGAGKMANLVVVDGDLFVEQPAIREVWVDGTRFEVRDLAPATVTPAGDWTLEVTIGDGSVLPASMSIVDDEGSFSGSVSAMGATLALDTIEVSGETLIVTFDGSSLGMPGVFTMELEISGDSARGSGDGPGGAFDVEGSRPATPQQREVTR